MDPDDLARGIADLGLEDFDEFEEDLRDYGDVTDTDQTANSAVVRQPNDLLGLLELCRHHASTDPSD